MEEDDSPVTMQVKHEHCIILRDENSLQDSQSIISDSRLSRNSRAYHILWQRLQDDLQAIGFKIKQHEDNLKRKKFQKNKLDETILDLQVMLGKYDSSSAPSITNDDHSNQGDEEIVRRILRHERSAAAIFCQMKLDHAGLVSNLTPTKDVLGVVATLCKVDDSNLSRVLSEYLGAETMLAIVCTTFKGVKALEAYDKEGNISTQNGLHGLATTNSRVLDGRFAVICLQSLIPYRGNFVYDDPQKRLDLVKPRLPNGECPHGFIGFAVNMINIEHKNLFSLRGDGHGLRETLFYTLFSRLQVYETREDMMLALPCISDGAVCLDGAMVKSTGIFSLRKWSDLDATNIRNDLDIIFPKSSAPSASDLQVETEKKLKENRQLKEKILEDINREQGLLRDAQALFEQKKQEFLKFLAISSSYAAQNQYQAARDRVHRR